MARTDNLYSYFVGWMKVLLPLAALALLSTIFLLARGTNTVQTIPYAELADMAREQGMTNPNLAGVTDDGSAVSITAAALRPAADAADAFSIIAPTLVLVATDGSRVEVSAGLGDIDGRRRLMTLTELVRVGTSSGYMMETAGIEADLASGQISSLGPLEVQAPFGTLTAGKVVVMTSADGLGQQMVFNGGVRLLYQPQP
jgi:lipopolysaccharide export system protein LptC